MVTLAPAILLPAGKNLHQLLRRHYFQLRVRAVLRTLVRAPSPELRHVPEAPALHMLIRNLQHQLRPQRLPRQILPGAPATLPAGHALRLALAARPSGPRMSLQRVLAMRLEE